MRFRISIVSFLFVTAFQLSVAGAWAAASAPDIGATALRVRELVQKGDSQVLIQKTGHEFKVFTLVSKKLDRAAAVELAKKPKGVNLRFNGDSMELASDVGTNDNPRFVVMSLPASPDDKEKAVFRLESYRLYSRFVDGRWPEFLRRCIAVGLQSYDLSQEEKAGFVQLTFRHPLPGTLRVGPLRLRIPDSAQSHLRVARKYPVQAATFRGPGVLLIHDPHASLAGIVHLVHGLELILEPVPADRVTFLMEGFNPNPTDEIPLNGLAQAVAANGGSPALVYGLARHYLVDSSMAYRLLSGRSIYTAAIDSNKLLAKDTAEDHNARVEAINLRPELSKRAAATTGEEQELLLQALALTDARLDQASSDGVVRYWKYGAQTFEALAEIVDDKALASKLKKISDRYKTNQNVFYIALERDEVMARNIARHVKGAPDSLHVAFIGSFHTPGIINKLRAAGIGATVIEPLDGDQIDMEEQVRFDRAVFGRGKQLRSLGSGRHKLGVGPTVQEVDQFYRPFLAEQKYEQAALATDVPTDMGAVDLPKIKRFVDENGAAGGVDIVFGGGKPPSPPPSGAFAIVDSGGPGRRARLVLLNPRDESWKEESRYLALRRLFLVPPKPRFTGEQRRLRATFVSVSVDGEVRTYACIHDVVSNKSYLVEGEKAAVASIMAIERGFHQDIHVQVAEIDATHVGGENTPGGAL